jgi:glycosyltransferase involved in cell wall biosynthesis
MMKKSRILFIQYGDYRDAVVRFGEGGEETYYAQKFSVVLVGNLTKKHDYVGVISVDSGPYDETLENGVHATGILLWEQTPVKELISLVEARKPDVLILRSPIEALLRWAIQNRVKVLPCLADSFQRGGLRNRWRNWKLAKLLNNPHLSWVANHNMPASFSLEGIGVNPEKILPWDWEPMVTPDDYAPKSSPSSDKPFRLFFAGSVTESKGVGDAIRASHALKQQGRVIRLSIAGAGSDIDLFRQEVKSLNLQEEIEFLGCIPHAKVVQFMREHDAILVPSRHEYPEGLPMVIYESFCTRTPLIVSDHPMFREKVPDNKYGLVFRAGDVQHFASRIEELMNNQQLYRHLSQVGDEAWRRIECPLKWGNLIHEFIDGPTNNSISLGSYTLAATRKN